MHPMRLAVRVALFLDLVGHVIGTGPEKQVSQTNARGVVARMQNLQIVRNISTSYDPRKTMCNDLLASFEHKQAVSIPILRGGPYPTIA
jgi:hypothetical protein